MWALESNHCKGENISDTREVRQEEAGPLHPGLLGEMMLIEEPAQRTGEGKNSLRDGGNNSGQEEHQIQGPKVGL